MTIVCSCSEPKSEERDRLTGEIKYELEYYADVIAAAHRAEGLANAKFINDIFTFSPTITAPSWHEVQIGVNKFFAQEATYTCVSEICGKNWRYIFKWM